MSRSQAERRQQTLQKLHEATIECIVNNGFSRLTTADIAETAGVSQGALFRYYPTKTTAVAGATRYLFRKVIADFNCLLGEPCKPDFTRIVDDLEKWFQSADFIAVSRLFAESSADAELKQAIQPIIEEHRRNTHALIVRAFPAESQSALRTAAHAVIYLLQGIATEKHLIADDRIEREIMRLVRHLAALIQAQGNAIIPDSGNGS